MKGKLCSMIHSLLHSSCRGLVFALCLPFFSLLFISTPVNAATVNRSGNSSHYWFGFNNLQAPLASDYDVMSEWQLVNTTFNSRNWPGSGVQRYMVKNVSHSASSVSISPSMVDSSGYVNFSGYVDLINVFDMAYRTDSTYAVRDIGSSYNQFNSSTFSIGFGSSPNVSYSRGLSVCSHVSFQNQSNPINSNYGAVVRYRLAFDNCRLKLSSGSYYFSWRLNGNNASNGGIGSYFAPYYFTVNGSSNYLKYYGSPSPYSLDFISTSTGGDTGGDTGGGNNPDYSQELDKISDNQQQTTDAIKDQTQQDKNQYESEKREENDRENQGQEAADQAKGIFNFNILNPFAPIFNLFSPNQCVNIPVLSGMIGSEDTQYCSWFPPSTRSILTPAFGIVSIMLLFGFVVRWLGGSNVTLFKGGA